MMLKTLLLQLKNMVLKVYRFRLSMFFLLFLDELNNLIKQKNRHIYCKN